MVRWIAALAALLVAGAAWAGPTAIQQGEPSNRRWVVQFDDSTTETRPMEAGGTCSASYVLGGSETVSLYQVATATTAASSGTLVATFAASTSSPTVFFPGLPYLKAVSDAGGSTGGTLTIRCSNSQLSSSGGTGVPGILGDSANDQTLNFLYDLRAFMAVGEQVTTTMYFDPYHGDDTNDGSYGAPMFSFYKLKTECLQKPGSRCVVKGRDRWFTHTLLTLAYTGGTRHLLPGEVVTFSTPSGTAEVLAVDGNLAAVTWLSGTDPRVGGATTFSAGGGESTGNVTLVRDSINGLPSRVIAAGDINTTSEVITSTGHSYSTGDGPFNWYSANDDQTFTANAITEETTSVWVCAVSGATFTLATDSGCTNTVNWNSAGTGNMQIIAGLEGADSGGLRSIIELPCPDIDRICTLLTSEFPDSPWGLDSGRLAGDGALYTIAGDQRWPTAVPYNTPTGGLLWAYGDAGAASTDDPFTTGWLGVENGIIQNLADDCLAAGPGGKLLALNVKCVGIRNGAGDRSQAGATNEEDQSHNSAITAFGTNGNDGEKTAGIVIWINGDGSWSEWGSDADSGAFMNPNGFGAIRLISRGVMSQDGVTGDTNCGGGLCDSPMMTAPGGDTVLVGTHFRMGGNSTNARFSLFSGGYSRLQMAKNVFESVSAPASDVGNLGIFLVGGGAQNRAKVIRGWNNTFKISGGHYVGKLCPLQGTSAATANSTLSWIMEHTIIEHTGAAQWRFSIDDCGVSGYNGADAVARATVRWSGIEDPDDDIVSPQCTTGPRWFWDGFGPCVGTCDDGTGTTFMSRTCNATDQAGNQAVLGQWQWFDTNSADSGGDAVDGLQWASADRMFRCADDTKECWSDDTLTLASYQVDLRSYFDGTDVTCIPADVVGTKICTLSLSPIHVGAR